MNSSWHWPACFFFNTLQELSTSMFFFQWHYRNLATLKATTKKLISFSMVPPIHLKSSGVRPKVVSVTFLFHQIWHRQKACCWNQQKKMQLTCQYGLTISSKPAVGSSITFRHCVCLGACDRRFSVVSCRDRGEYHDSLKVDHKSRFFDSG